MKKVIITGPFSQLPAGVTLVDTSSEEKMSDYDVLWFTYRAGDNQDWDRVLAASNIDDVFTKGRTANELNIIGTQCDTSQKRQETLQTIQKGILDALRRKYIAMIKNGGDGDENLLTAEEENRLMQIRDCCITIRCTSCHPCFHYSRGYKLDCWRHKLVEYGMYKHMEIKGMLYEIDGKMTEIQELVNINSYLA